MTPTTPTARPFDQHPQIEFPDWLQRLGFKDHSYRNDACALAVLLLAGKTDDGDYRYPVVTAWVAEQNQDEREYTDGTQARFTVYAAPTEEDVSVPTDRRPLLLYEGEDPVLCEAAIRLYLVVGAA